jgi:ADP-ribose pyrophosphatase
VFIRFVTKDAWIGGQVRQFRMVDHPGAAAVLVVQDGQVLMVEQYRPAANRNMLEIPAGSIDGEESPAECALRELEEETGYRVQKLEPMGYLYPTPGYTNEVLYLFLGEGLIPGEPHPVDGEDIEVRWVPLKEAEQLIDEGAIHDAKTIIAIFKYIRMMRESERQRSH